MALQVGQRVRLNLSGRKAYCQAACSTYVFRQWYIDQLKKIDGTIGKIQEPGHFPLVLWDNGEENLYSITHLDVVE